MSPDPRQQCGPYRPLSQQQQQPSGQQAAQQEWPTEHAHDTIAMVAVSADGSVAAGASSNGESLVAARQGRESVRWPALLRSSPTYPPPASPSPTGAIHKVPNRVGDAAVPGGGAYADSEVGGCGSTGDGDVHIAFQPCMLVVEAMRAGMEPTAAAEHAVRRIARRVPSYVGAVVAVGKDGELAGMYSAVRQVRLIAVQQIAASNQPPALCPAQGGTAARPTAGTSVTAWRQRAVAGKCKCSRCRGCD